MNFEDIDGLVFKKASIRMTNMPLYEMLGKAAKKDQDECVFQLKNSNIFTKKCLLPMHAVSIEDVADEI